MTRMQDNSTASSLQHRPKRLSDGDAQGGSVVSSTWQVTSEPVTDASCRNGDSNAVRRSLASLIARQIAAGLQMLPGGSPDDRGTGGGLDGDADGVTSTSNTIDQKKSVRDLRAVPEARKSEQASVDVAHQHPTVKQQPNENSTNTATARAGGSKRSGLSARSSSQPRAAVYPDNDFRGGE